MTISTSNQAPAVVHVPSLEKPHQVFKVTDDHRITNPVVQVFVPEHLELNVQKLFPFCGTGPRGPQNKPFDPFHGQKTGTIERKVDPTSGKVFYEIPMLEMKKISMSNLGDKTKAPATEYQYIISGALSLKHTSQGIAEGGCVIGSSARVEFRVVDDHGAVLNSHMTLAIKK